jgi:hypothetical protein
MEVNKTPQLYMRSWILPPRYGGVELAHAPTTVRVSSKLVFFSEVRKRLSRGISDDTIRVQNFKFV